MKKLTAILLTMVLAVGLFPGMALAASEPVNELNGFSAEDVLENGSAEIVTTKEVDGETYTFTSNIQKINGPQSVTRWQNEDGAPIGSWYQMSAVASDGNGIVGSVYQDVFIGFDYAKNGCYFGSLNPIQVSYLRPGWSYYSITSTRTSAWWGINLLASFSQGSTVVGGGMSYTISGSNPYDYAYIWRDFIY